MMKKKRLYTLLLLVSLVLILGGCSAQSNNDTKEVKEMAPNFTYSDMDGNTVKLSDFKGKKVYIKYWASWCPICLDGLDEINTLSGEKKDFEVLTVVAPGYQSEMNEADFKKWFSGVKNTEHIQVLFDKNGTYTKELGVRGYPTSEWIGADGALLNVRPGQISNETIKKGFDSVS